MSVTTNDILKAMQTPLLCKGPECDRLARVKGYCDSHYQQFQRTGTVKPLKKRGPRHCHCGEPVYGRGMCTSHYNRWLRYER